MKLGTETGSLINHLYSRAQAKMPAVGDGATLLHWTDRTAATVIEINGNIVTVQADHATRTDSNGISECQAYTYSRNPSGSILHFRLSKHGRWQHVVKNPRTRRWRKSVPTGVIFGRRDQYYDFSF